MARVFKARTAGPISGTPARRSPRMSARVPFAVALVGLLALAACDSTVTVGDLQLDDSDRVTGVWEGTSEFRLDTVLAEHNYRLKADYDVHFRFDVLHDDGLAWGTVTATLDGTVIAREAGTVADTFYLDPAETVIVSQAFGTYIRPELEFDVPFGPYDEDLWTFDKVAGRLDLQSTIVHQWRFVQQNVAQPDTFAYDLPMFTPVLTASRQDGETPNVTEPTVPTQIPGSPTPGDRPLLAVQGRRHQAFLRAMRPLARPLGRP